MLHGAGDRCLNGGGYRPIDDLDCAGRIIEAIERAIGQSEPAPELDNEGLFIGCGRRQIEGNLVTLSGIARRDTVAQHRRLPAVKPREIRSRPAFKFAQRCPRDVQASRSQRRDAGQRMIQLQRGLHQPDGGSESRAVRDDYLGNAYLPGKARSVKRARAAKADERVTAGSSTAPPPKETQRPPPRRPRPSGGAPRPPRRIQTPPCGPNSLHPPPRPPHTPSPPTP